MKVSQRQVAKHVVVHAGEPVPHSVAVPLSLRLGLYSELKLLHPGVDLATLTYEAMIDSLKKSFDKPETDMFQRYKFHSMIQSESEAAEEFILGVKLQAESCEFGAFKETAIRDKLAMGVQDNQIQQRLK